MLSATSTSTSASTSTMRKKIRVCVVCGDYGQSESPLAEVDDIPRSPQLHCKEDAELEFVTLNLHKKDVYPKLREAVVSGGFDVFFVMSDGALDEDRAGVEVVETLEKFGAAFTGAKSKFYELTKPEMKVLALRNGIDTAKFAVIESSEISEFLAAENKKASASTSTTTTTTTSSAVPSFSNSNNNDSSREKENNFKPATSTSTSSSSSVSTASAAATPSSICASRSMTFPMIVKHISGYSSVGMTKKNKVTNPHELDSCVRDFVHQYQSALIEEFVQGLEVTVLACGDSTQQDGIRVYPPVFVSFPEGEDFKHFDLKWVAYEDMKWQQLPDNHSAMKEIQRVTRLAFKCMMHSTGYGRVDLRVCEKTGKVVFLELNPNCGVMYPEGQEASADFILDLAGARSDFVRLQIQEALRNQGRISPCFSVRLDGSRDFGWTTRSTRSILKGETVMSLAGRSVQLSSSEQQQQQQQGEHESKCGGGTEKQKSLFLVSPQREEQQQNDKFSFGVSLSGAENEVTGGIPFPKAKKEEIESANVELDVSSLRYFALRDIKKGEELLL